MRGQGGFGSVSSVKRVIPEGLSTLSTLFTPTQFYGLVANHRSAGRPPVWVIS